MKRVFRVTATQRLIFVESAVEQMLEFRQLSWWHAEAGGVLLGRHLLDSETLVVDEVSTPQESDRRSRFSFFRSKRHEVIARNRWAEQTSTTAYLGLWHTHPQVDPVPSGVDRQDWQRAVSNDTFDGNRLFFPIVGTQRLRVWTLSRDGIFHELEEEGRQNG
jgi:integrative and conjugative element protein (TIGR02256 family)